MVTKNDAAVQDDERSDSRAESLQVTADADSADDTNEMERTEDVRLDVTPSSYTEFVTGLPRVRFLIRSV